MSADVARPVSRDGVLRTPPDDAWALDRAEPHPELAPFVVWHWSVAWDLRGREPHHQVTLPHPSPHLVVEPDGAWLYGPNSTRFERTMCGAGRVVGTRFRPGAVRALLNVPVRDIADRRLGAAVLRGLDVDALTAAVWEEGGTHAAFSRLEDALAPLLRDGADPHALLADRAVMLLEEDRSLHRVPDLAARLGLSVRSVQRLFSEYVGLGPAWVVRRYRLHDAAAAALEGDDVDWARLAADLGYADQAHLVREFSAVVGTPPARYAAGG